MEIVLAFTLTFVIGQFNAEVVETIGDALRKQTLTGIQEK